MAIALVVLFHLGISGISTPGGFIGVDVFFVLSGFLITGLIVREIGETGGLSFSHFYARRARRLLPAALVCLLVTLLAAIVLLPPLRVRDVAGDAIAASLYVSNIRFALQATDYFLAHLDPSPLLHYWSLGVEEQFYLVWPALLLVAARWKGMAGIAIAVVILGVASFGLSLWLTDVAQPWAFFSFPTRAWQLCLGAGVALAAGRSFALRPAVAACAALAGIALIVAAATLIGPGTPYPGAVAVVPAAGSALVILAGLGTHRSGPSRLLTLGPVRWLGRISYSLYLWHWPLLVLPAALLGANFGPNKRIAAALAAVVIAALSQRYVEEPVHRGRFSRLGARRMLTAAGVATLSVVLVAAVSVPVSSAIAGRSLFDIVTGRTVTAHAPLPADLIPPLEEASADRPRAVRDGCAVDNPTTDVPPQCVYGAPDASVTLWLIGDSKASQWGDAFERIAVDRGWRLVVASKNSCAFVDATSWLDVPGRIFDECSVWRDRILERLAAERPEFVVISSARHRAFMVDGSPVLAQAMPDLWGEAVGRMARNLAGMTAHAVVLGDSPTSRFDVPVCLSAHTDDTFLCATRRSEAVDVRALNAELAATQAEGATFIDPTPWVCPSDPCPPVLGNVLVYRDPEHLTSIFAAGLAPQLLEHLPAP